MKKEQNPWLNYPWLISMHMICHIPVIHHLYLKSSSLSWQFRCVSLSCDDLNPTEEIILFKLNCFILAFFTFIVGKCNVFPLTYVMLVSTYVLSLLSLNLLMKNITINAFYWHEYSLLTSSFFFFSFLFSFSDPDAYFGHLYYLFCLWFLSIPLWSDNDLLTQTRTIAMSLVNVPAVTLRTHKLVKDISFWKPLVFKQTWKVESTFL